jgi:signal transduction histidine kinase
MRIAQEALTNAFRHARATRIETEIIYDHSELRLRIRDNGCGIDDIILEQGRPDHWGLAGMRERAKKLHGQLEVWSRKGAGTEVELRVPSRIAFRRHRRWRWWSPDSLLTEQ